VHPITAWGFTGAGRQSSLSLTDSILEAVTMTPEFKDLTAAGG
jgi:hypothetical protein